MAFRLRYLAHVLEVPVGRFVVGRHAECHLSLDDPQVSRRHAMLVVEPDGTASIEDLGSRNGVFVNGARVEESAPLRAGDVVLIGSQRLELLDARGARQESRSSRSRALGSSPPGPIQPPDGAPASSPRRRPPVEIDDSPTIGKGQESPLGRPDRRVSSLSLLGGVADRALSQGRAEDAARLLYRPLVEVLSRAKEGPLDEPGLAEAAAVYATRLAHATRRGEWVDFVFELYTAVREVVPAYLVDEVYAVLRKVEGIDQGVLSTYCEWLRSEAPAFGPSERFVQQRIEGLERLGAT
jgi:hypothetical protein